MADKMMRIAGRGEDGKAKAIKTNNEGAIQTISSGGIIKEQILQNNATTVGNGSNLNVSGLATVIFKVTGDFDGEIWFRGATGSAGYSTLVVENIETGEQQNVIKNKGMYRANIAGMTYVIARVSKIVSGSVTVFATATTINHVPVNKGKRIVELGRVRGILGGAGVYVKPLANVPLDEYPLQFVTAYADASHDFEVVFEYRATDAGWFTNGGNMVPPITALTVRSGRRGGSEWVESRADTLGVSILNLDTVDHVYDLVLYGVK